MLNFRRPYYLIIKPAARIIYILITLLSEIASSRNMLQRNNVTIMCLFLVKRTQTNAKCWPLSLYKGKIIHSLKPVDKYQIVSHDASLQVKACCRPGYCSAIWEKLICHWHAYEVDASLTSHACQQFSWHVLYQPAIKLFYEKRIIGNVPVVKYIS